MEHPILSWAPFTQADVDSINPLPSTEHHINLYPTRKCFLLAQERTEVLNRAGFDDRAIEDIFNRTYKDCVIDRSRGGT